MAYDKQRIAKIISDISIYFKDLDELNIRGAADFDDKSRFYAVSMILFSIANRAIDLGDEIVSGAGLGIPSKYKEIFNMLAEAGLIEDGLKKKMGLIVYYRNLLSHEYQDFTGKDLMMILKKIDAVNEFINAVKKIIS